MARRETLNGPLSLLEYFSMLSSALSYLNTIPRYPTVVWTHHRGPEGLGLPLTCPTIAETTRGRAKEKRRRREQRVERSGRKEERPRQRRRRRRRGGKLEQSSRGLFFGGTYIRGHISRLALERSLSLSLFFSTMAVRSNVYIHTRGPPRTSPSPYTARRDRDAKETRAAFKLAATKRINSPGSLDLLIRAAVAFLRGLDRWGPETPRPSCFLAIASAAGRLAPSKRVCTPAVSARFHDRAYPASSCRRPTLPRLFGGREGVARAH